MVGGPGRGAQQAKEEVIREEAQQPGQEGAVAGGTCSGGRAYRDLPGAKDGGRLCPGPLPSFRGCTAGSPAYTPRLVPSASRRLRCPHWPLLGLGLSSPGAAEATNSAVRGPRRTPEAVADLCHTPPPDQPDLGRGQLPTTAGSSARPLPGRPPTALGLLFVR
ncbi:hypothetical protein MC885_002857 [Smutsia gigantea]|nr:hypothetical protein MC885_002857 [Smutsia gigantea]